MAKESLPPHERFPHVPAAAKIKPDPHGGDTCAEISLTGPVEDKYRIDARTLAGLHWMLHRMQIDADGVPGAYNDVYMDNWYPYNARGSYNYADSYSYTVVSVSGNYITCESDSDPRAVLLYTWRQRDPGTGTRWVDGYKRMGAPQAGDVMQFSGNSKLTYSCWPIVTRIVSVVGNTIVFETDKAATAALSKFDVWNETTEQWEADPTPVTVKVWHHAGNPADWRFIIKPEYFYGVRRTMTVQATAVPEDGIVKISDVAVMHPGGFDPLSETWTIEGRRIDTNEWENVGDRNARLYVLLDGPSRAALKTTKPPEGVAAPGEDLTLTYSAFRFTYWEKTDGTKSGCAAVGYARCKWSIPDVTGSNYGAGDGKAPPVDGKPGYVCLKRLMDKHTEPVDTNGDGIADSVTHSSVPASGAARFPAHGHCLQHGCCDQFTPAEDHSAGTPFALSQHGGHLLREMWGATNQRLERLYPRVPGFAAWQAQRVMHPSILWHCGYVGLSTPNIIDGTVSQFRGGGLWGTGYYTYSDTYGNEFLRLIQGGFDGVKFDSVAEGSGLPNLFIDCDGALSDELSDFVKKRNPVAPGEIIEEREFERIGVAVEKDTGILQGRGISQSSVAVTAQNVVIPAIDTAAPALQIRAQGSFEWRDGDGVVKVLPLRQAQKSPVLLGARTVAAVAGIGDGRVQIDLGNVQHTWSRINDGPEVGDSYDQKFTWSGGNGWPIMAKPLQQIDSSYEPHKYTGSRANGAWSGDAIGIGDRRFLIHSVEPFGGATAPTWGDQRYLKYDYAAPVIWRPLLANLAMGTSPETYGDVATITVVGLTRLEQIDRPESVPAGQFWFGDGYLLVGAAGSLQIDYTVTDKTGSFTEYVTVPAALTMPTMVKSADWTAADAREVKVGGATVTPTVNTSGTYVVFTLPLMQSALPVNITLTYNEEADAPLDHYSIGGDYLAYGKKRDVVRAWDDHDGFLAALAVGTVVEFYSAAAVMMPGAGLEFSSDGGKTWAMVEGADIRHGTGEAIVPAAWFDGRGVVWFRFTDCRLMDHRGIIPASVINKTEDAVRGLQYVRSGTGSCKGGYYSFGGSAYDSWGYYNNDPMNPCVQQHVHNGATGSVYGSSGNHYYVSGGGDTLTYEVSVDLSVESICFGPPTCFSFLPDGTEIVSVAAEISAINLTRNFVKTIDPVSDCGGNIITPGETISSTDIEDVACMFLGFTAPGVYDIIGHVPGVGIVSNAELLAVFQTMWDDRNAGIYAYGYGMLFSPAGLPDPQYGDVRDLLPGEGPTRSFTVCPGNLCEGASFTQYYTTENLYLNWSSAAIGDIILKVKYPDEEFTRQILMPRLPSMA